jgi:DNA-binding NtrC family response regulator
LPDSLIEREFFGHARGAFTDAREAGMGLVAQAQGGTLFLDEVDSLSSKGQVCLLRFLQDSTYRPIGGAREELANVRVIAAASPGIHKMVECRDFRPDLAYRLNILSIDMPPLRKRPGDVRLLAQHVLAQLAVRYRTAPRHLDPESLAWLERHEWPGNVRELENLLHREFLLCEGEVISLNVAEAVADRRRGTERRCLPLDATNFNQAKADAIRGLEVAFLTQLMARCQGNVTSAANLVGKDRRALGRMLKRHGILRQAFC